MGQTHWTHRFNWTLLAAVGLACAAFVKGAGLIADALRDSHAPVSLTVQIDNKGDARAFKVVNGELVPITLPVRK